MIVKTKIKNHIYPTSRNPLGNPAWIKGMKTPNPNGRPKLSSSLADTARAILDGNELDVRIIFHDQIDSKTKKPKVRSFRMSAEPKGTTIRHALLTSLVVAGLAGDVNATKEVFDRGHGKVKDVIITNPVEEPNLTDEEKAKVADALGI